MSRRILPSLALFTSLVLTACGSIQAGDECSGSGNGVCDGDNTALICQSGTYAEIPCKGAGGCSEADGKFNCALKPIAGDACPATSEGQGVCDPGNADQLISCSGGTWKTDPCNGCFVEDGSVMCYR